MRALVTVGTTEFGELVAAVCHPEFLQFLSSRGFASLTLQIGRGSPPRFPNRAISNFANEGDELHFSVAGLRDLHVLRYLSDLPQKIKNFDLVITHCGAGTLVEALRAGCRVVACVNETLLYNHQRELAEELQSNDHCVSVFDLKRLREKTLEALTRPFCIAARCSCRNIKKCKGPSFLCTQAASAPAPTCDLHGDGIVDKLSRPLVPLPPSQAFKFGKIVAEEMGLDTCQ